MKKRFVVIAFILIMASVLIGFTYIPGLIRTSYDEDEYNQIYDLVKTQLAQVSTTDIITADDFSHMITLDDIIHKTDDDEIYQRVITSINDILDQKKLYIEDKGIQEIANVVLEIYKQSQIDIPVFPIDSVRFGLWMFMLAISVCFVIVEGCIYIIHNKIEKRS